MFAIQLIHKNGGSKSAKAPTIQGAKDTAKRLAEGCKDYIAATIPYAVYKVPGWTNTYDVSLPMEILKGLGTELRLLYGNQE